MSQVFYFILKRRVLVFWLLIFFFWACSEMEVREERFLMGTMVELIVYGKNKNELGQAVEEGFREIERLERKLSRFRADSVISQINQEAGKKPFKVDEETFDLIERAIEICQDSEGAFDLTVLPLVLVWNFEQENSVPPEEQEIKEGLKLVGCDKIVLDDEGRTIFFLEPLMMIDLGGMAKGYGADKVVEVLKKRGVKKGIVNVGGDLRVFGGEGKGIAIGIQDPREAYKVVAKIYLKDSAIATSGDYQRFFIYQGVRYSHIIDPRTGYPARSKGSVSVITKDGLSADAWATALFVLGREKGREILRKNQGLEAVFIDEQYHYQITDGLKGKLVWLK